MTTDEYLAALDALGLTRAGQETAAALGVTVRHIQRYAAGEQAIPPYVSIILLLMLEAQGQKNKSKKVRKGG